MSMGMMVRIFCMCIGRKPVVSNWNSHGDARSFGQRGQPTDFWLCRIGECAAVTPESLEYIPHV